MLNLMNVLRSYGAWILGAAAVVGILLGLWLTDTLPGAAPVVAVDADCTGNVAMNVRYEKAFSSGEFTDIRSTASQEHGIDSRTWAETVTTNAQADSALGEVAGMRYREIGDTAWSQTIRMIPQGNDVRADFIVDPDTEYEYEIVLNEEGRPVVLTNGTFGVDSCPVDFGETRVRLEADSEWYEEAP